MADEILPIGTDFGVYHIVRKLGSGGMGTVYLAHDSENNRDVALKVAHPNLVRDEIGAHRFEREARAMSKIEHENFIRVFEAGNINGIPYYSMEIIRGMDLADYLIYPRLPIQEWKNRFYHCAAQICQALAYIHSQRIVHRDLKPSNIMIDQNNQVKIMDFGLVKETDGRTALTAAGSILGTAHYMSPEQCKGIPVDSRSDLYSLGVILYEMATRTKPFEGDSMISILFAHLQATPKPPLSLNPDLHPAIERIIQKLLQKEPFHRYQTAEEVLGDLIPIKAEFLAPNNSSRVMESSSMGSASVTNVQTLMDRGEGQSLSLGNSVASVRMKDVLEMSESSGKAQSLSLFQAPLVGRDEEVKQIRLLLGEGISEGGPGAVLFVAGELGVGKSRLLQEILAEEAVRGRRVYQTRPGGQGAASLHTYETLFEPILADLRGSSAEEVVSLLGENGQVIGRAIPEFLKLPGVSSQVAPVPLAPDEEWLRVMSAVKGFVLELLKRGPMIFSFDQIQSMDEAELELLWFLVENIVQMPHAGHGLIICAMFRPEELPAKSPIKNYQRQMRRMNRALSLELPRMELAAVGAFIRELFGRIELPDDIIEAINRECNGNPYFITETVRTLIDRQIIMRRMGRWILDHSKFQSSAIPGSIAEIIRQRLESLDEEERDVLSAAAVIGEEFDFDTLLELVKIDEDDLIDIIDNLVKGHLLEDKSDRNSERYIFHQAKIRDFLYDELAPRKRRKNHQKVAETLEEQHAKNLAPLYSRLAYHCERGEDWEKTFKYSHLAAEQDEKAFLNRSALAKYDVAINSYEEHSGDWEELPETGYAQCLLSRSQILAHMADYEHAAETYKKLIALPEKSFAGKARAKAFWGLGEALFRLNLHEEAEKNYQEYLDLCTTLQDQDGISEGRMGLANLLMSKQKYEEALVGYQEALAPGDDAMNPNLAARLHCNIGGVYYFKRDYTSSLEHLKKASEIASVPGAESVLALSLNNMGAILEATGESRQAFNRYQEALAVARRIGKRTAESMSLLNMGMYWKELGEAEQAIKTLREAYALKRELGDKRGQARALSEISAILALGGNYEESMNTHREALGTYEELGDKLFSAICHVNISDNRIALGELEEAIEDLQRARDLTREIGDRRVQSFATMRQAYVWALCGEFPQAYGLLDETHTLVSTPTELAEQIFHLAVTTAQVRAEEGNFEAAWEAIDAGEKKAYDHLKGPERDLAQLTAGMVCYHLGRFAQAENFLAQTFETAKFRGQYNLLWQTQVYLGATLIANNDAVLGKQTIQQGLDLLEQLANNIQDASLRQLFHTRADRIRIVGMARQLLSA